jgi:hypothetical protein
MARCRRLLTLALVATVAIAMPRAGAQELDGITIIEFLDATGQDVVAKGDYIVTFVSALGSYAAVVARRGTHGGCQALAVPGSYTGRSITFGMAGDDTARRQRLRTYCPTFTVRLESDGAARIAVPRDPAAGDYELRQRIVARVPLRPLDFGISPFSRHDVKGVRLGPVLDGEGLGPLRPASDNMDRHKSLARPVTLMSGRRSSIHGHVAASEVTGWPWDVLYAAHFLEEFGQASTFGAFEEAVLKRHGEASVVQEGGSLSWLYDLAGRRLALDESESDGCRATADFWLRYDASKRVRGLNWDLSSYDLGPWGCSLLVELNPNRGNGGIIGYSIRAVSGYAMAVNHFLQRIGETAELARKLEALQGRKPTL